MNCLPSLRVIPAFTRWCCSRFLTRDTHTKVDATAYWKLPWLSLTSAQLAQFLDWVNSKARKRIHFGGLKMSSLCFSPSVLWGTRRKGQVGAVGECRQYICWCCLLTTTARKCNSVLGSQCYQHRPTLHWSPRYSEIALTTSVLLSGITEFTATWFYLYHKGTLGTKCAAVMVLPGQQIGKES